MNTWHPYENHRVSAHVLSARHLGQVLGDCTTLIFILSGELSGGGRQFDTLVQMWTGSEHSLCLYTDAILRELHERGYYEEVPSPLEDREKWPVREAWSLQGFRPPVWLGDVRFHCSQRASLMASDPEWYGQMAWDESPRREVYRAMSLPRPGERVLARDGTLGTILSRREDEYVVWCSQEDERVVHASNFVAGEWRRCQVVD